jgi:glyceraldehyde 3-phosphate dehydrogenase
VLAILDEAFGVQKAMLTTVHGYTSSQALVDSPQPKDLRRGRAAAMNMIPTSTGAAIATAATLPQLTDLFDGISIRVPVPTVSLSDMVVLVGKEHVTIEEVNAAMEAACKKPRWKGIVTCTNEPLVSTDFIGDSHSATIDLGLTRVTGGNLVKVVAWYDNEWGYSNRLAEMAMYFA